MEQMAYLGFKRLCRSKCDSNLMLDSTLRERRDKFIGGQILDAIFVYVPRKGDVWTISATTVWVRYFYPRPPQGGRRVILAILDHVTSISIHALRKEGDMSRRELMVVSY